MRPCLVSLALLAVTPVAAQEVPVNLELVLAVDISGSVDLVEAHQQRQGYVTALADPAVIRAIRSTFTGRVAVAYVEWADTNMQEAVVPWTLLEDEASARAFSAALAEAPISRGMRTSISGAIDFSVPLFDGNGFAGERRVIDISGDGVNTSGRPVQEARDEAVTKGIVINGLPILNDRPQPGGRPTPMEMALDRYFTESVIGGPGSFVVPALGFDEFKDAILQKLILEIAGTGPAPLAGREIEARPSAP
jgi:hypothetical protein